MYAVVIFRDEYADGFDWVYGPVNYGIHPVADMRVIGVWSDLVEFSGTLAECEAWVAKNYPELVDN